MRPEGAGDLRGLLPSAHPDDYAPPCEAPTVEHDGVCYYAVQAPKREPSAVSP